MQRFRRLLPFLLPYKTWVLWSFIASSIGSLLDGFSFALLIPFLRVLFGRPALGEAGTGIERILDVTTGRFFQSADPSTVLIAAVGLIFVATLLKNVALYVGSLLVARIEEALSRDLRVALHSHLVGMHLGYIEGEKSGQFLTRMLADADQAKSVVIHAMASLLRNAVLILVYVGILVSLSWRLTAYLAILVPVLVGIMATILTRIRSNLRQALDDRGELTSTMSEAIQGARVVKAFGGEEYERGRFAKAAGRFYSRIMKTQKFAIMASPVSETLGAAAILFLVLISGWLATGGSPVRPELLMTFLAVTIRLLPPVRSLSQFPTRVEIALAASDRIFEVIDVKSEDADRPGSTEFPGITESLEFNSVDFGYTPDIPVLREISARIPRGHVVGIVGPSGAGKSTLIDLIPRFLEPWSGSVSIDGRPTTDFTLKSLRASIGVVSQHTVIFNDTVTTNIAYGEVDPDHDRVVRAAKVANAHEFVARLGEGYDTVLGERGTRLSGGERQRLALARAIYRDPPILILDEATSSLDTESERLVQEAIDRLFVNRTVVVIAHRLSTVVKSDLILVMDGGRIVETGTHAELLRAGGLYGELYSVGQQEGGL